MVAQQINLTLEELASEVALTLQHYQLLGAAHDSRVSPVPDARTIRYYTTLGLLDRPWMEGRQAKYGKRHLLQVITIKALQGRGMPLSDIQSRIYGMTDAELESLLASMAQSGQAEAKQKKDESIRPITWKEVVIEPGLKLMVEEGWSAPASMADIEAKIRAALAALTASKRGDEGEENEHGD